MRGVAALWVVLCHYSQVLQQIFHLPNWLYYTFANGWFAVDLFFILSGFIMVHAHPQGAQTLPEYGRFLRKRLARIYPVHLVTLVFAMLVIGPAAWSHTPSIFDYIRYVTLTHAWWNYSHPIWNGPNWSLSAEWGAYLVFPFLYQLGNNKSRQSLLWSLAIGLTVYVAINIFFANTNMEVLVETGLLRSIPCFLFGVWLYRLRHLVSYNPRWGILADTVAITIPITLAILGALTTSNKPVWLLTPMAACWIFALSYNHGLCARLLSSRAMVQLGLISFSLYMTHTLIQNFLFFTPILQRSTWLVIGYLIITFIVAKCVYQLIEVTGCQMIMRHNSRVNLGAPVP